MKSVGKQSFNWWIDSIVNSLKFLTKHWAVKQLVTLYFKEITCLTLDHSGFFIFFWYDWDQDCDKYIISFLIYDRSSSIDPHFLAKEHIFKSIPISNIREFCCDIESNRENYNDKKNRCNFRCRKCLLGIELVLDWHWVGIEISIR